MAFTRIPDVPPSDKPLREQPPRRYERLVPVEPDREQQAYDFQGPSGDLRPWVLWTPDDLQNPAGLGLVGLVIPYTTARDEGYLVFVPQEMLERPRIRP